jgi:hypothetical protein
LATLKPPLSSLNLKEVRVGDALGSL